MHLIGRLFLGTLILCLGHSVALAKEKAWVASFDEPYVGLYQQLVADPFSVREQLLENPPTDSTWQAEKAQYYLILSLASDLLSFPEESLVAAERGLEQLYEPQQPWLFHFLQLAKAAALDTSGMPSDGLRITIYALAWAEGQQDTKLIIYALATRGRIFNSTLNYDAALADLQRAYSMVTDKPSVVSKGSLANAIGQVYESRFEGLLAMPYLKESVAFHRKHNNWIELSMALFGEARSNKFLGNLTLSKQLFKESADIARRIKDEQGVAYVLMELAELEFFDGNYDEAELMFLEAQKVFDKANNQYLRADVWQQLARLSIAQNMIDKAEQYFLFASELVDPKEMRLQQQNLELIQSEISAKKGEYKKAFEILQSVLVAWGDIFNEQSTAQLHQLRTQYEITAKEKENKILERDNELQKVSLLLETRKSNLLLILFLFSTSFCVLLAFWFYRSRQHKQHLEVLANTDSLTGLYNRRKALELSTFQMKLANRHSHELCLALLDLDHFKSINDTYGHQAGDIVLSRLGKVFKAMLRNTDIVGRVGGEEFVVVLPHTSLSDSFQLLEKLRAKTQQVSEGINIEGLTVTISIGLKSCSGIESLSELMAQADKLLYRAKSNGRDRIEVDGLSKCKAALQDSES